MEANIVDKMIAKEAPVITKVEVIPVAGRDSMLLNLSGAHAPFSLGTS